MPMQPPFSCLRSRHFLNAKSGVSPAGIPSAVANIMRPNQDDTAPLTQPGSSKCCARVHPRRHRGEPPTARALSTGVPFPIPEHLCPPFHPAAVSAPTLGRGQHSYCFCVAVVGLSVTAASRWERTPAEREWGCGNGGREEHTALPLGLP